ncbi:MAG: glycoside hydrolase family 78 protein [Faecalicatena sp.]|uniref:alpha-L-rhamnosidase n=1 Tax=Faecalicatena sp. TaxID=2005360 RepID=UPI00258791C4|nr:alpha-L-rhamnosidase [Faecalicatena sp.]MCI6464180.1 glycoside hydrolase family 78 protein [Faecalicatena sp.]MDY5621146.1 family 78 glycoside hydrolase catalytic domain [Lachnospiraceae bacterium]
MRITNIRINGIENPRGFLFEQLICSWNVRETESKKQTNVVIEVSTQKDFQEILYKKEGADLDQSGEKLELKLQPRTSYFYRITVTGDKGDQAVSEVCTFETGKRNEDWRADWISPSKEDTFHPVMIRNFSISRKIRRARLYATGVGLFEAYLNGEKLGEEYLAPYMNNYEKNIQVMTFPLDDALKVDQENTLEILLGKGWYMGTFGLDMQKENYGNRMAAIAELHLEYEDGTSECICTDESWEYYGSDIEDSGIYFGEILNRTLWDGKENPKRPVEVLKALEESIGTKNLCKAHLMDRMSLPVLVKEQLLVQEIVQTPAGETVLDMGQNFAGYLEFHADFPKGTKIVLDFGEILQEGNFYNKNYREAKSQFVYVSNGTPERVRAHFTFFGFRYVRVSGWPGECRKEDFIGKVLYSDLRRTGYVTTGNEKINRLYKNTVWGLKSNFIDMPTDCPQRSERLGWTGDAQVFAPTASYHMDTRAFFHKFVKDLRDEQQYLDGGVPNYLPNIGHKEDVGSVWGDIATFLPHTLYTTYGNLEEVEYCYPLMKDWVDYIDQRDAQRGQKKYLFNFGFHFGDWLALDGPTPTSFKGSTDDDYIASVYYYRSAQIVRQMAERLEKQEDAAHYKELEEKISQAVKEEFFTPTGRLAVDTQAAYVIALKFGLYIDREKLIEQFRLRLKKDCNQIKCGFVGAPLLCTVLAEAGLYETAYDFLLKEGFPSWLYSVNLGATTIWERWNSVLPDGTISDTGMNSLNHYAYGSVMEFVYAYAAGIRPLKPGFKRAVIAPHPDIRLGKLECLYDSVNGLYVSNWSIESDGTLNVHVEIPFGCEAEVELPDYPDGKQVLSAGAYDFVYRPNHDLRRPYHKGTTLNRIAQDKKALEVLGKYAPAIAGIAASGDPEMGANTLEQILSMGYLPFDPNELKKAITEITELEVAVNEVIQ